MLTKSHSREKMSFNHDVEFRAFFKDIDIWTSKIQIQDPDGDISASKLQINSRYGI